jgi:hypothetical protein
MQTYRTELLIIGGGCSGAAAGIQAARMGVKTLIIEETPWLGGMITSAGVSAFDGNKFALGGGIFGELRKMIEDHYGGADKTFTGWISLTCFEPKIGAQFLHQLADAEEHLDVWYESSFIDVIKSNERITGATVKNRSGAVISINAEIVIEATECGDVIKSAGLPYRLGRDARSDTGEPDAPETADDIVQDMTFCATLKKYPGSAPAITPSANYDPRRFINSTSLHSSTNDESYLLHKLHDWQSFISYAAFPDDKYLLNWPFHANDYPTTIDVYENKSSRAEHYRKAKELTLDFIFYMQTYLGHPEWGLALDEYPTGDHLPFIPYFRESRRIHGLYLMREQDVVPAKDSFRPPLRSDSIAVGDYFLDHHHSMFFIEPPEARLIEPLPPNAPFQIPLGCLIPKDIEGMLVAEKSISVTHIVNGCTRLQPVTMLIGQAAGALAALAIRKRISAAAVNVQDVQNELLLAGCQLFPYKDHWNTHPDFIPVQQAALLGIYFDESDHALRPDDAVSKDELNYILKRSVFHNLSTQLVENVTLSSRSKALRMLVEKIQSR